MRTRNCLVTMLIATLLSSVTTNKQQAKASEESKMNNEIQAVPTVACQLSGLALDQRTLEIQQILTGYDEVRESEDGYSLRFPGNEQWTDILVRFVRSERRCCSFFKFELTFEPEHGPIWLFVGGSKKSKAFIDMWID